MRSFQARVSPPVYVLSVTMIAMGDLMLIPAAVEWLYEPGHTRVFLNSAGAVLALGLAFYATTRRMEASILPRQAFLITTLVWIVAATVSAVPFFLLEHVSIADAFFESMSGITTTGATVLVGLDGMPPSILLWRSILQWAGGLGFIAMAVAVLPKVGVGGMRLFRSESSDWSEKSLPKARSIAAHIALSYLVLSMICAACYWLAGMSGFDAVNHAMTTLSTGGYSTSDASMGKFDSSAILWISTLFMLLGCLPFVGYAMLPRSGPRAMIADEQVVFFVWMVLLVALATGIALAVSSDYPPLRAFTVATFNVVSVVSTTGYSSVDYTQWGPLFVALFLFLMFTGGCSGSTSGSIKAFRLQLALRILSVQLKQLVHPQGVFTARFNGRSVEGGTVGALVAFVFATGLIVITVTILLAGMGLDLVTALSAAATAVTNVGPGLGATIGPAGNFSSLPEAAKWVLSGTMLLGRLELMTVVVLFSRQYWGAWH